MPNPIKYSTSAQTLALKKGNYWIGTGDVGKGPTSTTDYWNGITPPAGGYTIYLNKASGGPSIYTAANDSQLISLSNTIAGQTFATAAAALAWFATQTDKMVFDIDYEAIVTNGLVLNLDAGFTPSYPTTGTTWYDVSSGGNNGTLTNGPTFNSANSGSIVFDGVDDYVTCGTSIPSLVDKVNITACLWIKFNPELEVFNLPIGKYGQGQPIGWEGFWFNDGRVAFGGRESAADYLYTGESSAVCPAGSNIYNVVYRKSGSLWSVYVNGTSVISTSLGLGNVSIYNSSAQLEIGRAEGGYNTNCSIYVSQVYDRALSTAEILQNYNAQKGRFGL